MCDYYANLVDGGPCCLLPTAYCLLSAASCRSYSGHYLGWAERIVGRQLWCWPQFVARLDGAQITLMLFSLWSWSVQCSCYMCEVFLKCVLFRNLVCWSVGLLVLDLSLLLAVFFSICSFLKVFAATKSEMCR